MSWKDALIEQTKAAYNATEGLLGMLDDEDLSWQPASGENWMSVGQLLEHLAESCGMLMRFFVTDAWDLSDNGMLPAEKMPTIGSLTEARERLARDRTGRPRFRWTDILIVVAYAIVLLWLAVVLTGPPNNMIEFGLQHMFGRHDLSAAQLNGAVFVLVDLSGVDLSGANLSDAYPRGIDLRKANLRGADLSWAIVSGAQLTKAACLKSATKPDGSVHE